MLAGSGVSGRDLRSGKNAVAVALPGISIAFPVSYPWHSVQESHVAGEESAFAHRAGKQLRHILHGVPGRLKC